MVLAQEKFPPTTITNAEVEKKHANSYASIGFYVLSNDEGKDRVKKVCCISFYFYCISYLQVIDVHANKVQHITQFSKEERVSYRYYIYDYGLQLMCSTKLPCDHTGLIIMPTTFKPNICNNFSLSVYGMLIFKRAIFLNLLGEFDPRDIVFKKVTSSLTKYTHNSCWYARPGLNLN